MSPDDRDGDARFFGKYKGFVKERSDPDELGRLRAQVPEVLGNELTDWAWPCVSGYGGNTDNGMFPKVPDVGAGVWIEFEAGDVNRPIWTGVWWGKPNGTSDVPKLARGQGDETTQSPKGTDSAQTADGKVISEPQSPFAAKYPENRVLKTKNGIVVEYDDTPGKERVQIWHPKGTYLEIHPDGKEAKRVQDTEFSVVEKNREEHVKGSHHLVVEGDGTLHVFGDRTVQTHGDFDHQILGNYNLKVVGDTDMKFFGKVTQTFLDTLDQIFTGKVDRKALDEVTEQFVQKVTRTYLMDLDETCLSNVTRSILAQLQDTILGTATVKVTGLYTRQSMAGIVDKAPTIGHSQ